MTTTVTRYNLQQLKGMTPKLLQALEELFVDTASNKEGTAGAVAATGAIQNATVLTLSPNAAFGNERILAFSGATFLVVDGGPGNELAVALANVALTNGGFACMLNLAADTNLELPTTGKVATADLGGGPFADDTAAAAGGIAVGEAYRQPAGVVVWRQA